MQHQSAVHRAAMQLHRSQTRCTVTLVSVCEDGLRVRRECPEKRWRDEPHAELIATCRLGTRVWLQSDGGSLTATYQTPADVTQERREAQRQTRKCLTPLFDNVAGSES